MQTEYDYRTTVVLTKGRHILLLAEFDIPQAEVALEILGEEEWKQRETAIKMTRCLEQLRKKGPLGAAKINVSTKSRSGLIRHPDVSLGWRVVALLARAILMGNPEGIRSLKTHLEKFTRGLKVDNKPMLPFMFTEGIVPKG